jgi:DNA-binding LacI/PurR family transcriptional regulator
MKNGRTNLIGVWMPVDRPNITFLKYLQAINARAHEENYDLLITGLDASMAYTGEGRQPNIWPVDGVISLDAGKAIRTFREDRQNDDVPVAVLGLEEYLNSDRVSWDIVDAARQVTRLLIARGCTSILHVTMDWVLDNFPREQRRRGYTEAMAEGNLAPSFLAVNAETSHAAASAVSDYIKKNGVPQAIFAFTDTLAIGAARAVFESGSSVPEECVIWGYGDYPESEDFRVPLSTIRIPMREVVDQAWTWLMERIEAPLAENRLSLISMELIERKSTQV